MATQKILARQGGKNVQIKPIAVSQGSADAGKVVATGSDGRLDESVMPLGIGANTTIAVASEAIGAGKFVNLWEDAGVLKARLADNSNNRPADGFVSVSYDENDNATIYPLDNVNSNLSGLTVAGNYWLGTAGGVIDTPLDGTSDLTAGYIDQYLGKAKSATELITTDDSYVVL